MPINRILEKKKRRKVISIIGIIEEIKRQKNGNLMLTIEDSTGRIKAVVSLKTKRVVRQSKRSCSRRSSRNNRHFWR